MEAQGACEEEPVGAASAGASVGLISAEDTVPAGELLYCSSFKGRVQAEWKNKQ